MIELAATALWASLPLPALVIDAAGRIAAANSAAETFLNLSTRSLLGKDFLDRLSIDAPIATRQRHRSTISGSRAAFSITLVPRASTAAITTFSVAMTLISSRKMSAPTRPWGALMT